MKTALAASSCSPSRPRRRSGSCSLPGKSPLVTFRFVFTTGSASDPVGQTRPRRVSPP